MALSTMLRATVRTKVSDRKLRLFAVACCRRIGHLMKDERSQIAVTVAERYADGLATNAERQAAYQNARATRRGAHSVRHKWEGDDSFYVTYWACHAAIAVIDPAPISVAQNAEQVAFEAATAVASAAKLTAPARPEARDDELATQRKLLRDIVGKVFVTSSVLDPTWRSPKVVELAQQIYERRSFERMPELATALKEAGCDSRLVLNHCLLAKLHTRGCWVVDLILGKR
jgi:hypothetical protein